MSYGTPKSVRETILEAACSAPSDAVMTACIRRIGKDVPESIPATKLTQAAGRIDGTEGRRVWKRAKCTAAQASIVAATCNDPELLTEMADREKRQGALHALCNNPALPLGALARAARKVNHYSTSENSPVNVARRRLHSEELDEATIAEVLEADRALLVNALAGRADLTTERAVELLTGEHWLYAVVTISHRPDLPDLGRDVVGMLFERDSYGVGMALAEHPRLLELGTDVIERLAKGQALAILAKRGDLPETARDVIVAEAGRNPSLETWRAIRDNPTFDRGALEHANCNLHGGDILGAVLAHRFGGDEESWETALGLFETFLGKPIGELVETVEALRSGA